LFQYCDRIQSNNVVKFIGFLTAIAQFFKWQEAPNALATSLLSCGASKLNKDTGSPARSTRIVEKLTVKLEAQQLMNY